MYKSLSYLGRGDDGDPCSEFSDSEPSVEGDLFLLLILTGDLYKNI